MTQNPQPSPTLSLPSSMEAEIALRLAVLDLVQCILLLPIMTQGASAATVKTTKKTEERPSTTSAPATLHSSTNTRRPPTSFSVPPADGPSAWGASASTSWTSPIDDSAQNMPTTSTSTTMQTGRAYTTRSKQHKGSWRSSPVPYPRPKKKYKNKKQQSSRSSTWNQSADPGLRVAKDLDDIYGTSLGQKKKPS
jgi:hypothetical protein